MRRLLHSITLLALSLALGACINSSSSSSGADPVVSEPAYYYDEFSDVPLPKEMRRVDKKTFITHNSDGTKVGTQEYRGRVELASLAAAMQSYMLRDGWTLRSTFRADRSILIFERPDRMCALYLEDGTFDTVLLVFVSPKLGDGALQYSVPSAASTPAMNNRSGNVTIYPPQPLQQ